MGIAAGMKDIAKDIANSYDLRMADVGRLKEEANKMLGSFKASYKKMGVQLRRELADDKAKMGDEVKAMRSGFQSSRKEMSSALKKDLAEHTQVVRGEVARLRQGMGASHQNMSAKLRRNLAQGAAARKSEVHVMLNDFQRAHNQMGKQLRKELAHYDRGIESEVAGMRQETKSDLGEARAAWQGLTSTMQAKRGGIEVAAPPKARFKATEKALEALVSEEQASGLNAKLLAAVNQHPEGITLVEVAKSLSVAPIVLGRASRRLLREGAIIKKEMLYFPARAE